MTARRAATTAGVSDTLPAVTPRWLSRLVVAVAVLAAWGSAPYAGCLTALLAAALVALLALPPGERRLVPPQWVLVVLAALAAGWAVALDHELALRHSLLIILAGAVLGLARRARPDDRQLGVLALAIAAAGVVAVLQVAGHGPVPPEALDGIAPELRERAARRLAVGRASGTASVPGHFAALEVMVAPLLAAGLARGARWRRLACGGGLLLAGVAVVLTRSLAGVVLALSLAALAAASRRPARRTLAVAAVGLLALGALTALLRTDLAALEPIRLRWVNWRTAAWAFAQHPLLGVGLGGVGQAGLTAPTAAANITPYAHNTWLGLAAELGAPGVALALGAAVALWRLIAAGRREHLPLALAVAALPLHNLVDFSAYAPEVLLPWAVLAGALAARVRPDPGRLLPSWLAIPVLGGAVLLAAASWRSEVLLTASYAAPPPAAADLALASARWAPWAVTPLQAAAGAALAAGDPRVAEIERALATRWWVRPVSSAWAETRARLLLAGRRDAEALAWAREARRRAPWRGDLAELEVACSGAS